MLYSVVPGLETSGPGTRVHLAWPMGASITRTRKEALPRHVLVWYAIQCTVMVPRNWSDTRNDKHNQVLFCKSPHLITCLHQNTICIDNISVHVCESQGGECRLHTRRHTIRVSVSRANNGLLTVGVLLCAIFLLRGHNGFLLVRPLARMAKPQIRNGTGEARNPTC